MRNVDLKRAEKNVIYRNYYFNYRTGFGASGVGFFAESGAGTSACVSLTPHWPVLLT